MAGDEFGLRGRAPKEASEREIRGLAAAQIRVA